MGGLQQNLFTSRYAGIALVLGMLVLVSFIRISLWLIVQEVSRLRDRARVKRRRLSIFGKPSRRISFHSSGSMSRQMSWPLSPRILHRQGLITLGRYSSTRLPKSAGGSR